MMVVLLLEFGEHQTGILLTIIFLQTRQVDMQFIQVLLQILQAIIMIFIQQEPI